jgi:hypothetical protein
MKKSLSIGVLTLASMWLTAGTSSAGGTFGLFTQASCWPFNCLANCHCCGGCGCSKICVKPYNAFSPNCSGTLFTDDISGVGNPAGCGRPQGALPCGDLPSVGCCDSDSGGTLQPTPAERAPVPPTPVVPGTKTSFIVPGTFQNYGPMQIGYYYPNYMPTYNNNTQPMAVPYYWNSGR